MFRSDHLHVNMTRVSRGLTLAVLVPVLALGWAALDTAEACSPPTTYTLTVQTSGQGTATPSSGTYSAGTVVTLTATASSGWVFDRWEGSISTTNNPTTITMNSNKTVTAVFLPEYTLTTSVQGSGSISLSPSGGVYKQGTTVTLTASATVGYVFDRWEGDASGTNPVTSVTMTANKSVTAVFVETLYTLSLSANYNDAGSASASPAPGAQGYMAGASVTLSAVAASGWQFHQWTGDLSGSANPASIVMDSNKSITAVFVQEFILSTNTQGSGTIALTPSGGAYAENTTVTIAATPSAGWRFDHWEGDASGSSNPTSVVMTSNKSVTAVFIQQFALSVSSQGDGSVTPSSGIFDAGAQVTLTATPGASDVRFAEWQGDLTGSANPATVTMDSDKVITALFIKQHEVTITVNGEGTVSPESGLYDEGSEITLTATPEEDWAFDRWSGDLHGGIDRYADAIAVQIEAAMNVYADFIERPGLSSVDMVSDLGYFLTAMGQSATVETFDRNRVTYDETASRVYTGNGIPDVAELYLLETVLNTRHLDLTHRSGIAHEPVWEAWQTNLAQAQTDLAGQDARVLRVVAGYMTLGDFDNVESVRDLVESQLEGVTLDPADYDRWAQRFFWGKRDADNDGVSNIMEWQTASPTGSLDDLDAFAAASLDGDAAAADEPDPPAAECDNADCVARGGLDAQVGYLFIVPGESSVQASPSGEDLILGTEYKAQAHADEANGWGFAQWIVGSGQSSMLNNSRLAEDSEMLQCDLDLWGLFTRYKLQLPDDTSVFIIEVQGHNGAFETRDSEGNRMIYGPNGSYVTLTAKAVDSNWKVEDWETKASPNAANPKYSREKIVTLPLGTGYARPRCVPKTNPVAVRARITLDSNQGGIVWGCQSTGWGATYRSSIVVDPGANIDLSANAGPEWEFVCWEPELGDEWYLTGVSSHLLSTVTAVFKRKEEFILTLDAQVTGDGEIPCAGYVTASPAKRYYGPGETVTVTAHPTPSCCANDAPILGYRFAHWDGDGMTEDSNGQPVVVSECTDPEMTLTMDSDRKVTAVFEPRVIYVIALSGEQWLGGPPDSGILEWASELQSLNPEMFDLHLHDEDDVHADGSGDVFDDLVQAINDGEAPEILMVGHSHGGGSVADLCTRIDDDPNSEIDEGAQFSIIMTAYVDAIANDHWYTTTPETAYPALTQHHVNLFQTIDVLNGAPVPGSIPDWNVNNVLSCVSDVGHTEIDSDGHVHTILTDYALWRICNRTLDTDYCE